MVLVSAMVLGILGCRKAVDDVKLPPSDRAERFDTFAEEGMDWKELVKGFNPTQYRIVVPSSGEGDSMFSNLDGRSWTDWDEKAFVAALGAAKNFDSFYFQYQWSSRPVVFHDVAFGKDGKVRSISLSGRF
jgi:hypothetical protein